MRSAVLADPIVCDLFMKQLPIHKSSHEAIKAELAAFLKDSSTPVAFGGLDELLRMAIIAPCVDLVKLLLAEKRVRDNLSPFVESLLTKHFSWTWPGAKRARLV